MAGLDHDVVPRDRYPGRRPGAWRIPVASGDGDLESFIDQAIAVIIQCVEDLGSAGFDGRIAVVAIGIISHVTQGLRDGILRYQGISKSVAVSIRIPGCAVCFINLSVAVIIQTVELVFSCTGVDTRLRIVAIATIGYIEPGLAHGIQCYRCISVSIAISILVPRGPCRTVENGECPIARTGENGIVPNDGVGRCASIRKWRLGHPVQLQGIAGRVGGHPIINDTPIQYAQRAGQCGGFCKT